MELPPGFRFHPTDEELITQYLSPKIFDRNFSAVAIGEVDLNKVEPWELPGMAKMGDKEWYFFCLRDPKYQTGSRTNRATLSGYWKATGKDKEIFKGKMLVGIKKTLVFYQGRAPKGEKTTWVMHEYRIDGKYSRDHPSNNQWVISRILHKGSTGIKSHISELVRHETYNKELQQISNAPTNLLDISTSISQIDENIFKDTNIENNLNIFGSQSSFSSLLSPTNPNPNPHFSTQFSFPFPDYLCYQHQSILKNMMECNGQEAEMNQNRKILTEFAQDTGGMNRDIPSVVTNYNMRQRSYDDQEYPITSNGQVDLDCLWNY